MLKVDGISKSFGSTLAVDNLSFELKKGDITGLLGPNGAGKTTTMRMIASYLFPSKGKIYVNDIDTSKKTLQTQQMIGYLPENNPLYLDMIVSDYLNMTAKLYGMSSLEIKKSMEQTAKSVGIADKMASPIGELSKGYKQRVGLAAALLHNPSLLILDEPTEGLDPIQREEIRRLIKKLAKEKVILLSTHVMQEVKAMCNSAVVINKGKLVIQGDPDKLSGTQILILKITGQKLDELQKLPGVSKKDVKINGENITISTDQEIRPEINKLAQKYKWTIWEMHVQDSLETVFESLKEAKQ